jgi:phage gpG-like protein
MGIEVKNNINIPALKKQITASVERELGLAMNEEVERLVQRTQSGIDVDGRSFESYAPYTPKYLKFKTSKGRKGNIDLTFKDRMLNNITSKVERMASGLRGTIFFSDPREGAKAQGNQRKRPFFGLSKDAVKRIMDRMQKALGQK